MIIGENRVSKTTETCEISPPASFDLKRKQNNLSTHCNGKRLTTLVHQQN